MNTKTYSAKPKDITRQWYLIDASTAPLGRVATLASKLLIGKHKPSYTPHIDGGDYVVVINTGKAVLTGNKGDQKRYYRHSGYPGSLKSFTAKQLLEKDPNEVVASAVMGMLPKNKLQSQRMNRLKLAANQEHQYQAQKPKAMEVTGVN